MSELRKQRELAERYITQERYRIAYRESSVEGTYCCEFMLPYLPMPVGTVWFRRVEPNSVETLHSFVIHVYRRLGIRTLLHDEIRRAFPGDIVTAKGTKEGRGWLLAIGFKETPDGFVLRAPKGNRRRNP